MVFIGSRSLGYIDPLAYNGVNCHDKVEEYLKKYVIYDEVNDKFYRLDEWFNELILYAAGEDGDHNLYILAVYCYVDNSCMLSEYIFSPEEQDE